MKQVTGLLVVASVCAAKVGFVEQLLWSTVCLWHWAVWSLPRWGSGCSFSEEADLQRVKMLQRVTGEVLRLFLTSLVHRCHGVPIPMCLFRCHSEISVWMEGLQALFFPYKTNMRTKRNSSFLKKAQTRIIFSKLWSYRRESRKLLEAWIMKQQNEVNK